MWNEIILDWSDLDEKIIGNLLYDTEKAEKIYSFMQKRKISSFGGMNFYEWYDIDVYKTNKDNYFIHGYVKDKPSYKHFIEEYSEPEFEKLLKEIDPDKYIELGFNDFENA